MAGRKVSNAVAVATAAGLTTICGVDKDRMARARAVRTARWPWSTEYTPKEECCKAVKRANFGCLCRYRGMLRSMGNIDADRGHRAMQIPSKCNIPGAPTSCYQRH